MRLNLGSCSRDFAGFLSVDIRPPADIVADLSKPWPWPNSSVEEVLAYSVFEHLPDKRHTLNELWRVLVPGGIARIQLPHATLGDGGHCDPTHCSYWTTSDFEYWTDGDPCRERFDGYYGVIGRFNVLGLKDGKIPLSRYERRYGGYVVEMNLILQAVK